MNKIKSEKLMGYLIMNIKQKRFIILSLLSISMTFIISFSYFHVLNTKFRNEIYTYLEESSHKNAAVLQTRIMDDMTMMKILAASLNNADLKQADSLLSDLNKLSPKGNFKRLSIVDTNGICHTPDGKQLNVKNMDYIQKSMQGDTVMSDARIDRLDQTAIVIYSTPIYHGNSVTGVLVGVHEASRLTDLVMSMHLYSDSFTVVMDNKGQIVLQTNVKDIAKRIDGTARSYLQLENEQKSKEYYSRSQKKNYLVSYTPIGVNDWYSVSFVPAAHISQESRDFNRLSTIAICCILLVVLLLLFYETYQKKKNRKEKEQLLFEDKLTKKKNFNWFMIQVQDIRSDEQTWLIVLNISDFHLVNAVYGYTKGDEALCLLANKLTASGLLQTVARKENDCFVGIASHIAQNALSVALRQLLLELQQALNEECAMPDLHIMAGFSPWRKGETCFNAIDKARCAMRCSTILQPVTCYAVEMDDLLLEEKKMESRMEEALKNKEFKVYLQPKVSAKTGHIIAAEALIRWQDPQQGLIPPYRFIPLFEKNGFLEQVDLYTFEAVCRYLRKWEAAGIQDICISFNLSPSYIFHKDFVDRMEKIIQASQVNTGLLEVEITESSFAENTEALADIIRRLHACGLRIAMDDFGSGYSSLNMLKELPIQTLKIDQGFFVTDKEFQRKSEKIVALVIEMAKQLKMDIVAEGIETKEQLQVIQKCGCDIVQGYYYYKPMPIDEFEQRIRQEKAR